MWPTGLPQASLSLLAPRRVFLHNLLPDVQRPEIQSLRLIPRNSDDQEVPEGTEIGQSEASLRPRSDREGMAASTSIPTGKVLESGYSLILGSLCGTFGASMVYQIDLVKTRMQNQRRAAVRQQIYTDLDGNFYNALQPGYSLDTAWWQSTHSLAVASGATIV